MKVKRAVEVETNCFKIGDQISIDHYTATCQTVMPKGVLFLMDQYLDKPYAMNPANTNKDGQKIYTTDVVVDSHEFCESKQPAAESKQETDPNGFMKIPEGIDEELPFN